MNLDECISYSATLEAITDPNIALMVRAYGAKHNNIDLVDEHTLRIPVQRVFDALSPRTFMACVQTFLNDHVSTCLLLYPRSCIIENGNKSSTQIF
jgi:hypothetical protein